MRFPRLSVLALSALAAACATATAETALSPAYYVMRHLDTPEGERDPDLTAQGQRRAALLADWFRSDRPAAIYVSDFRRTRQTAGPIAARLGLTAIVYDVRDTPGLIARVRAGPLPALVVGHSNTVPDIVEALGGTRPAPLVHADFGDIWTIYRDSTTQRRRVDQD
jgi:broad specificity phosphatase PhoE